jgi:hypothetical protein
MKQSRSGTRITGSGAQTIQQLCSQCERKGEEIFFLVVVVFAFFSFISNQVREKERCVVTCSEPLALSLFPCGKSCNILSWDRASGRELKGPVGELSFPGPFRDTSTAAKGRPLSFASGPFQFQLLINDPEKESLLFAPNSIDIFDLAGCRG